MSDVEPNGKRSWPSPPGGPGASATMDDAPPASGQTILGDGSGAPGEPGASGPVAAVRGKRNQ